HSRGLGQGSEFVVRLPLPRQAPADGPPPKPAPARPAERPLRVLVVDDNRDATESLAMLLELKGHTVYLAHDGPAGLDAARAHHPEVVLLDIGLPRMDGYEVARRLREDEQMKDVFLVAMTGYGQDADRRRSREAGFDCHLVKPVDLDDLQGLISRCEVANA